MRFRDRTDAGRRLAGALVHLRGAPGVQVLALPRGGVPVAREVARALAAPLDVFLVRKLGLPGHEELAMGAIATGGTRVLNDDVLAGGAVAPDVLEAVTARERAELERRARRYRGDRPPCPVAARTVVLVDDGIATGSSARAAIAALRRQAVARLVVAVPVAPPDAVALLEREADEVVALETPEPFYAVGLWYDDFAQTTDEEVQRILAEAALPSGPGAPAP